MSQSTLHEHSRDYPPAPSDVYLYATCLVDLFTPEAGIDTVRLLEHAGVRVHFPTGQSCCGQPAYTSGFPDAARTVALSQLRLFPEPWPVVIPSGSCAGMLRHHYVKLFADQPELCAEATALAERVFELAEFLVEVLHFKPQDRGSAHSVAVHTSCSARREMGTHEHSAALLGQLSAVRLCQPEHATECCGFGGTFSLKHPSISAAMTQDKIDALKASSADSFVSADCGCLLNLNHRLQKQNDPWQGTHLASFLCQRLGLTTTADAEAISEPSQEPIPELIQGAEK
ncbi:MAG: (Fe-S)-binding protein [Pseudomonadota bacterium]